MLPLTFRQEKTWTNWKLVTFFRVVTELWLQRKASSLSHTPPGIKWSRFAYLEQRPPMTLTSRHFTHNFTGGLLQTSLLTRNSWGMWSYKGAHFHRLFCEEPHQILLLKVWESSSEGLDKERKNVSYYERPTPQILLANKALTFLGGLHYRAKRKPYPIWEMGPLTHSSLL